MTKTLRVGKVVLSADTALLSQIQGKLYKYVNWLHQVLATVHENKEIIIGNKPASYNNNNNLLAVKTK